MEGEVLHGAGRAGHVALEGGEGLRCVGQPRPREGLRGVLRLPRARPPRPRGRADLGLRSRGEGEQGHGSQREGGALARSPGPRAAPRSRRLPSPPTPATLTDPHPIYAR